MSIWLWKMSRIRAQKQMNFYKWHNINSLYFFNPKAENQTNTLSEIDSCLDSRSVDIDFIFHNKIVVFLTLEQVLHIFLLQGGSVMWQFAVSQWCSAQPQKIWVPPFIKKLWNSLFRFENCEHMKCEHSKKEKQKIWAGRAEPVVCADPSWLTFYAVESSGVVRYVVQTKQWRVKVNTMRWGEFSLHTHDEWQRLKWR